MATHARCWLGPVRKNPHSASWLPEHLSWQLTHRMRTGLEPLQSALESWFCHFLSKHVSSWRWRWGLANRVKRMVKQVYRRALLTFRKCEATDKCRIVTNTRFSMHGLPCPHLLKWWDQRGITVLGCLNFLRMTRNTWEKHFSPKIAFISNFELHAKKMLNYCEKKRRRIIYFTENKLSGNVLSQGLGKGL